MAWEGTWQKSGKNCSAQVFKYLPMGTSWGEFPKTILRIEPLNRKKGGRSAAVSQTSRSKLQHALAMRTLQRLVCDTAALRFHFLRTRFMGRAREPLQPRC